VGIGQSDNLAGITWISDDLLIASKRSIENNFASSFARGANAKTRKYSAVG